MMVLATVAGSLADGPAGESKAATRPAPPTEQMIRATVQQLHHPVASKRRLAVRQLAEWGPIAFPELRRAAEGTDLEAALSARDLLEELESAILIGADVHIEAHPARTAWDQPLTLVVTASNPTDASIRVPWPAAPASRPASQPSSVDAEQVGAILDAADFLSVTGPDGKPLEVRVDPIERDSAVYAAVNSRAGDNPPSHVVPAGATEKLEIRLFNRGWARYPMLAAGKYTIAFGYQPEWKDASWTQAGFGRVIAAPVQVEVTTSAPEAVRGTQQAVSLQLRRSGGTVEARLLSHWDREQWINLDVGPDVRTQARLDWSMRPRRNEEAGDLQLKAEDGPRDDGKSRATRFKKLAPGEDALIAQIPVEHLLEHAGPNGKPADRGAFFARYSFLASREQLRQRLRELGRPDDIPLHLFTGAAASDHLLVTRDEKAR